MPNLIIRVTLETLMEIDKNAEVLIIDNQGDTGGEEEDTASVSANS